jgi:hypothetical protein
MACSAVKPAVGFSCRPDDVVADARHLARDRRRGVLSVMSTVSAV